ncbi:MAG: aldo/keto reductase [Candidatus Eremiobacteraeota bacterium]|nr:aldo/keto reductase [Candidatus Eremiobacteraeota bacterium]
MQTRAFGRTGVRVPAIGQGTWDIPEHGARMNEAIRALKRGIDLGMTHIDTAEMYGNGRAEEIVARAIAGHDRGSLFLTSKVLPSNATGKGTKAACERSLKRLGTPYLDLYLLHWPSSVPIEETIGALEELVADGKTRFIGVSNFEVDELQAAQAAATREPIACNQVLYHLKERGIESRLVPYCKHEQIAVVAYTPFGRGKFAADMAEGGVLRQIAQRIGKTPRAVALRFLTRDENLFTIPKAATVAHVEENAAAADFTLCPDDIAAIDSAFPARTHGSLATL